MDLKDLIACLVVLKRTCMTIGRLSFLKLLMLTSRDEKLNAAEEGFTYIDQSDTLQNYLLQSFNKKLKPVQWDRKLGEDLQKIIKEDSLFSLAELQSEWKEKYFNLCNFLKSKVEHDIILYPLFNILQNFQGSGHAVEMTLQDILSESTRESPGSAKRIFFGPSKIKIDEIFDLSAEDDDIFFRDGRPA